MKLMIEIDLDLGKIPKDQEGELKQILFYIAQYIKLNPASPVALYDSKQNFVGFYKYNNEPLS